MLLSINLVKKFLAVFLGKLWIKGLIYHMQTGIISPSKLRMKLMGPHHHRKKDGSNSNSSRTSPSRIDDTEFVKNSLLASNEEEGWFYHSSLSLGYYLA